MDMDMGLGLEGEDLEVDLESGVWSLKSEGQTRRRRIFFLDPG